MNVNSFKLFRYPKKHLFSLLLILGIGSWGISFTFVKVGIGSGSPYVFFFYKFSIAFVVLSILFFNRLKNISKETVKIGVLISIPLLAGNFLQSIGLKYTTVSNSAFITGLDVLLIPILKYAVYKKKVANKIWFACIIALIGLYIIAELWRSMDRSVCVYFCILCVTSRKIFLNFETVCRILNILQMR